MYIGLDDDLTHSLEVGFGPASILHSHLKGQVLRVELEFVDLTDQILKQVVTHGRLSGHEVDAVVCSSHVWGAIILYWVVFAIVFAQEDDSIVDGRSKLGEWLFEVAVLTLRVEVCNSTGSLATGSLIAADVVNFKIILIVEVIELSANTVLLEEGTTSSLEFGDLIPSANNTLVRERGSWVREMTLISSSGTNKGHSDNFWVHQLFFF